MRKRSDEVMVDMAPGPTVMAPQHRPRIWLEFDDGSAVGVRGAGLIGRDPAPATGDRFEHLITLADDTLSVSRTHLEFGTGESGLWIRERSSTNGSVIEVNGHRAAVPPGMRVPVRRAARSISVLSSSWFVRDGAQTADSEQKGFAAIGIKADGRRCVVDLDIAG